MSKQLLPARLVFGWLVMFCVALLAAPATYAQVTNSAINGVITDAQGAPLPGATVIAVHEPSGTQYGTVTTESGLYSFPSVRVGGPYRLTVTYVGFKDAVRTGFYAELGSASNINVKLAEDGTQLNEVVVTGGRTNNFNGERTGAATGVTSRQIMTLPTVNRNIGDFTKLTPQANGNSFGGRDGRYNNFQVDGANFNNGFGLSGEPLPGGGGLPLDAIEEIQVNLAPFDVRQSGFSGAGINAVTRSGTNKFTGSAYGYFSNQNFQGNNVAGTTITRAPGKSQTFGFRLGGPIIKNKLFFFVNAENINKTGSFSTGSTNLWKASADGKADPANNITRVLRSDLDAVSEHLKKQWGYDPGAYENYANDNADKTTSLLARIDWNINQKHKLAVRYNQVIGTTPFLVNGNSGPFPRSTSANRVSQLSMAFANTMYSTKNLVRSITAELNSELSPRLTNQLLYTFSRIQATRTSPSAEFPMIDIGDGAGTASNYVNYISAGYELFTYGNDVLNNNWSVINNLTYIANKHTLTAGVSFESQLFGNRYQREGTSYYRYASVADFLKTGTPNEVAPIQFALTYPYPGQDNYAPIRYGLPAIYVQDKFTVNERLNITAGIRAEIPMFLNSLTPNPSVDTLKLLNLAGQTQTYNTGSWPKTRLMLSPRVGFRFDVKGDKSIILRGGTGIFAGRVPFVWLTNMPSNLGVIQNTIEPGSYAASAAWIKDIRFNPDKYYWLNNPPASAANVFIKSPKAGLPGTVALVDHEFKMPQIWRTSFGVDLKIPGTPLTFTGDVMYTKDLQGVYQFGANRKASTLDMNNAGDTRDFYPNAAAYTYNSKIGANSVSVLSNTNKGESFNATLGLTMSARNGVYGSLFYSHTTAKTISDNPGSNALSAWGGSPNINNPNDLYLYSTQDALPNRIIGTLSYRVEYLKHLATTVSLFYTGANQGRVSYTYNGDLNGDGISADLLYVPTDAAQLTFAPLTVRSGSTQTTYTPEQQRTFFQQYLDANPYLKDRKGQYTERNGQLMPWLNRFDFKFLQDIFTNVGPNRHTLQFSLDILNVGNLLNNSWGIQKTLNAGANQPLTRASVTAAGVPTFTVNPNIVALPFTNENSMYRNVTTTNTTWQMLMGFRYLF